MRSAREALTASRRAPLLSALGVITIAFSLFAFGLFALVAINIRKALDQVEERVEVRAFLGDSADIESVAAAMKDVGEFPEVNRVDDPFEDYYLPLWRADKVAVSTFAFHGGNTDPKYAWNAGERLGLAGRASLWPLAGFAIAGAAWTVRTLRRRGDTSGVPPAGTV